MDIEKLIMENNHRYCIIMAGGLGNHFWPMSRYDKPKQFIDLMGTGESMLQATYSRMQQICPKDNIIIVTSGSMAERVSMQIMGLKPYQLLCEPARRNTAPCIAYAASIIYERDPHASVVVVPSDHAIFGDKNYLGDLNKAFELVERHNWIITMGARPTSPNTKYGYIQFDERRKADADAALYPVVTFTEKPPVEMATQFIASGEFFWNAGIFVWSLSVLMEAYRQYLPAVAELFFELKENSTVEQLENVYASCESVSVDTGIMERADNVHVMEASFGWSDVETWEALYDTCSKDEKNNVVVSGNVFAYDTENCIVHMPQNKTIVLQGLDGYVVAGNTNYIFVCKRDQVHRAVKFASDVELRNEKRR